MNSETKMMETRVPKMKSEVKNKCSFPVSCRKTTESKSIRE